MLERGDQNILQWFGHMERMDEGILIKRIYKVEVDRATRMGRVKKKYIKGVKEFDEQRCLNLEYGNRRIKDKSKKKVVACRVK